MPPRAVLLDLFHTLVDVTTAPDHGLPTHALLGLAKADYERAFYAVGDASLAGGGDGLAEGAVRDLVECLLRVARSVDPDVTRERVEAAVAVRRVRFRHALTNPPDGVLDGLAALRAAGVRLALVSNVMHGEAEAWPDSPLAAHFETAVFSSDVGVAKPDPRIYRLALDRLGLAAPDCWFAGDGGSNELRGAREVGCPTVLVSHVSLKRFPEKVPARRAHADHEVHGLPDLARLVLASP